MDRFVVRLLIIPLFLIVLFAGATRAEDIYIAQTTIGSGSGADAANAHSVDWFNTAANWTVSTGNDGKIGPGDIVFFHGDITSEIQIKGDGAENAPIVFDGSDAHFLHQFRGLGHDYYCLKEFTVDTSNTPGLPSEPKPVIMLANDGSNIASHVSVRDGRIVATAPNQGGVNTSWSEYIVVENNRIENVPRGVSVDRSVTHDIIIRNNFIRDPVYDDDDVIQTDNIMVGDAHNVLIEGNHLIIRSRSHSRNDNIEVYLSGNTPKTNTGDITIRYNLIEMMAPVVGDGRSWCMLENLTGFLKIYGNVFVGENGNRAGNGINMWSGKDLGSGEKLEVEVYFYNNTYVVKDNSGPNDGLGWEGNGEIHFYNNAVFLADGNNRYVLKNTGDLFNLYNDRDFNLYYGGRWDRVGSLPTWLEDEPHSWNAAPLFADPDNNDFSPTADSPLVDHGSALENEYAFGLKPGTSFPAPELVARPQTGGNSVAAWDIGAYEFVSGGPAPKAPARPRGFRAK